MKKLLVMLLAAALCVSLLAGCTKSEAPAPGTSEATQQESQTETKTETETSTAPATTEATGLRDFTCLGDEHMGSYFLMANTMEEFTAWQALRKMMEAKNINLVPEFVADDQYQSMLQTRFASMSNIPMFCYNRSLTFFRSLKLATAPQRPSSKSMHLVKPPLQRLPWMARSGGCRTCTSPDGMIPLVSTEQTLV